MYKFQNHIEVLEAIAEIKKELPAQADSSMGQAEIMLKLTTLYACLDVEELISIISDFKKMNRRDAPRVDTSKNVA